MIDPHSFEIEILEQGWLEGTPAERDLCSHGRIRLALAGLTIADEHASVGVSESALALLRTLESDHDRAHPVADRLIFHGCGAILMMGCPIGIDWSVSHRDGWVEIEDVVVYPTADERRARHLPGLHVRLTRGEYCERIVRFAEQAQSLFSGVAKVFSDAVDEADYRSFWVEFDSILVRQKAASSTLLDE